VNIIHHVFRVHHAPKGLHAPGEVEVLKDGRLGSLKELVEDVVVPLPRALRNDPHLWRKEEEGGERRRNEEEEGRRRKKDGVRPCCRRL
jgi:hypothetical protein